MARRTWLLVALWLATGPMGSAFAVVGAGPSGHELSVGRLHGRTVLLLHHADHDRHHDDAADHHDHHRLVDRLLIPERGQHDGDVDHAVSLSETERLNRPERSLQPGHEALEMGVVWVVRVDLRTLGVALVPTPGPAPPLRRSTRLQI
jgi:hypothetical protein